ncbi:MAG: AraC family transcriptional regulator [Stagnimonas sp.]|nr:AraC family transcriptional regulator [Stagnimonas sp.]
MTADANPPAFTALASWTRAVRKALLAAQVDADALLREAGIAPESLSDPQARLPVTQTTRLWKLAVAATGDPAFGLKVAREVQPTTFHALGYALAASTTLGEAFARAARYCRIVTDAGDLAVEVHDEECHVLLRTAPGESPPAEEATDAFAALQARTALVLTGGAVLPRRVELRRVAPADATPYERAFRAPVRFGADENRLVFAVADCARPLEGGNAELARLNESLAAQQLARLDAADLPARLRALMIVRLPDGEPTAADLAAALHLSLRSLQRKLAERGLRYEALLDDTRHELAQAHLRDARLSLNEVAFLLGFSDASSFTRAFRRWTSLTPSAWREQHSG